MPTSPATTSKRIEREQHGVGLRCGAHVVAGLHQSRRGARRARGVQLDRRPASGEARFYAGKIYGVGKAAVARRR